jgi:tRNA nucleotidyltransferase (CCA-adding enzyme)
MSKYLKNLPPQLLKIIELAKEVSFKLGCKSYLVGGCVRDLILKRKNFDLDISVEGDGINFANTLASCINAKVVRHQRFGTATVISPEGFKIDVASCRKEYYSKPAMLPEVVKGDIKDDLSRRDFTINAVAIEIYPETEAGIIDFFGGYSDILRKKIRVLHERSFIDDPTRILRAIRFEQRFGFNIERNTLRLIKEAVLLGMFQKLSPHRLRDELILIFKEETALEAIHRIEELVGWDVLIPGIKLNKRKITLLNSVKRVILWYNKEFPHKRKLDSWLMYMICLLDGATKSKIDSFLNRFSFKRGERKRILSYVIKEKKLRKTLRKKLKPSKVYMHLQPLSYEVILLLLAKSKDKNIKKNIEDFLKIYNNVRLKISGKDLKELGISEGPDYQTILKKLLYAKLDRGINTKEKELSFVRSLIKR